MAVGPDIVGRALELEAVDRFLTAVAAGAAEPVGLLIEGEAGVGKSMLWRAAIDLARQRSIDVLMCAPAAVEQALSFVALRDLLAGDASLADSDVFAGDLSSTGLTNQLGAVRTVLAEANGRLVRISGAILPGPPTFELDAALSAVRYSAAGGYDAIATRLGGGLHPPSPCHSA